MILAALGVMLVTLLGFAALAVDVANGYAAQGMLQHAVDDAARTAQRWSAQVDDPGADPAAVQAQAVAAAIATAQRDLAAQGLGNAVVQADFADPQLHIAARASVGTWFLRALGITSWSPSASSDVALWTPVSPAAVTPAPGPAASSPGTAPAASPSSGVATAPTVSGGPAEGPDTGAGASSAAEPGPEPGPDTGSTGSADSPSSADSSSGGGGGDAAEGY